MRAKLTMLFLLGLASIQVACAQAPTATNQKQADIAALRTDVKALQAEQRQIIARLDELRQLLQPSRQPTPNVTSISLRSGETFRGDSAARVAI